MNLDVSPPHVWIGLPKGSDGIERAGVVHQNGDGAEFTIDVCEGSIHGRAIGDIQRTNHGLVLDRGGRVLDLRCAASNQADGRACRSQALGDRPADSPARTRNDCDLALEIAF
jgi:hypothetical protein